MDPLQKRSLGFRLALIGATLAVLAFSRFGLSSPAEEAKDVGRQVEIGALAPYKGKVILVNLFATWCGPCIAEIPDLVRLQSGHADLAVVGLQVMDVGGEPLPAFRARLGINYPTIDANDNPEVQRAFGDPDVLPMSYILDRSGRIVATLEGRTTFEEFERRLALYF